MAKLIWQNKLKFFISVLLVILAMGAAFQLRGPSQAGGGQDAANAVAVKTETVSGLKSASGALTYPATVAGDQEVKVVAQIAGVANSVNFDLGDRVAAGKLLVRVDDQGTAIGAGESGFRSGQIQQLEIALEIAEESLELARDNYDDSKTDATKAAKDIAKLQVENARIALDNAVNARLITSPISGVVTSRGVSAGDTVSAGELLATISKTNKVKIQFFADSREVENISAGTAITVRDDEREISAKITNIAPQADAVTKRFLVEAMPARVAAQSIAGGPEASEGLLSGTIVAVSIPTQNVAAGGALILPLSAITITQNENYIFVVENGPPGGEASKAKKVPVEVRKISGETAEVVVDLLDSDEIIVEGNKLVQDGDAVEIK